MRPRLLDLFCKAGGCTKGYQRAGFYVKGVDVEPQRRYCGEEFEQADAIADFRRIVEEFKPDVIHASPPCQAYTSMRSMPNTKKGHPDLIPVIRCLLVETGRPYVIENVPGSPLDCGSLLCGTMFGLGVGNGELRRHRRFECSFLLMTPPCSHRSKRTISVYGNHGGRRRVHVVGVYGHSGGKSNRDWTQRVSAAEGRIAMGIDWMTWSELAQAIPPAYTEFIGRQLIDQL